MNPVGILLAVVICAVAADPYNAKNYQAPKQDEYVQPVTNKEPKVMSYQLDDHSVKIITYHNPRARTYQQDVYYTAPDATYEAPKVPSYKKEEYPSQPVTTYQAPSYEQPKEYEPKPMTYQQDSYTKEENHETTSFATAEDCEKITCFAAFSFYVWYCPSHAKYQKYKLDVKYPTEQYWGRYQKDFDHFVARGCDSKEGQLRFDKCLQKGAYLEKFIEAPKVFT